MSQEGTVSSRMLFQRGSPVIRGQIRAGVFSVMEWQLNPWVCQTVFDRLNCLHVDLFTSRFINQLQLIFLSWADHQALQSYILDESGLLPVAPIPVVLLKLSKTQSCLLLLVVSLLPRHLWFRHLLELMVPEPVAS